MGSTDNDSKSNDDPNNLLTHTGIQVVKALVLIPFLLVYGDILDGLERIEGQRGYDHTVLSSSTVTIKNRDAFII